MLTRAASISRVKSQHVAISWLSAWFRLGGLEHIGRTSLDRPYENHRIPHHPFSPTSAVSLHDEAVSKYSFPKTRTQGLGRNLRPSGSRGNFPTGKTQLHQPQLEKKKNREKVLQEDRFSEDGMISFGGDPVKNGSWAPRETGRQEFVPTKGGLEGLVGKNPPSLQETQVTWVRSLGPEDPLEEGIATHSGILAWRIPWMEEPGRLQSTGL